MRKTTRFCSIALLAILFFLPIFSHASLNLQEDTRIKVLRVSEGRDGKHFVIELLVPSGLSKKDVIEIANSIMKPGRSTYLTVDIEIWDSKEAYMNRDNDTYPDCAIFKHWLVRAEYISSSGFNEIEWLPDKWASEIANCMESSK
jgi:hypothetical protein